MRRLDELTAAERAVLGRNNVTLSGRGERPMVFSHGFGTDQSLWRFLTPYFDADWRIVLFDLVGSGDSDHTAYRQQRYRSLDAYAEDLLEICRVLAIYDTVFIGHSISGMIGVRAANRDPVRFDSLVLVGASARYLNDRDYVGGFEPSDIDELMLLLASNQEAWSQQMAPLVMANADRPELAQELANTLCKADSRIAGHFGEICFSSDSRAEAAACKTPSLIVQCTNDVIAPQSAGQYLHRVMRNSTYALVEASGHFPHISSPDAIARVIKDYLRARQQQNV